jgi:hypothetical protein
MLDDSCRKKHLKSSKKGNIVLSFESKNYLMIDVDDGSEKDTKESLEK